ncbi:hypothetical protein P154DRAFT_624794 [Amniculicola lignicola CBS 123094]|uniref:Zn(2)-C6 fungal-type domain-containing protein n=1 Tax=Amniculicola lignicola CBS 123094 TaxID=1392246 RepID=A0A6A5W9P6_9PLEO|nr:hypothetical protein P154DRAFT_624794 [Amniculicola lignicola CBS 123094]
MFATFAVGPPQNTSADDSQLSEHVTSKTPTTKPSRPKRHQVGRACIWCRTYRIKCDANVPCQNCKVKGRKCSDEKGKDAGEVRTFSTAVKEIDRLKERIKELEDQVKGLQVASDDATTATPNERAAALPVNLDPLAQHGGNKKYYNWDFVSARTARTNQQFYGPSSSFYFISQMMSHLNKTLREQDIDIQPRIASRHFSSTIVPSERDRARDGYDLTRSEEERLIELFLRSYHGIYPVIEVDIFKRHHALLWGSSTTTRKPSALHDIVLALAMQYGAAISAARYANTQPDTEDAPDATTAGRWLYRRCQSQLSDELEGPSITTFQCHLLSVLWLSNASFQNMAHNVMALGIRTGVILGLHLDPCPELPPSERECKKRLWWTLYALEMKFAMELGRPLAVSISQVTCSIPDDIPLVNPIIVGAASPPLTAFHAQLVKLILATRAIYITFYRKCASALNKSSHKYLYEDAVALESCAEFLHSRAKYLQIWLGKVPEYMKTRREDSGWPFSTDGSQLDLETVQTGQVPVWLARQRVFLELSYHDLLMSLYRPFICFGRASNPTPTSTGTSTSTSDDTPIRTPTPLTTTHARACLSHAITTTTHLHHLLTTTSLLDGFHEPFRWQWNAVLSLLGYMLAYPTDPSTPAIREALDLAIIVFERLAGVFGSTRGAVQVVRELVEVVERLGGRKDGGDKRREGQGQEESGDSSQARSRNEVFELMDEMLIFQNNASVRLDPDIDGNANASTNANENNTAIPAPASESDLAWAYLSADQIATFPNPLSNPSGFAFTFDSFNGLPDVGLEDGPMFDLLDFGDIMGGNEFDMGFGSLE